MDQIKPGNAVDGANKEETHIQLMSLVNWMQTGLNLAERNLQLKNYIDAHSMTSLKGGLSHCSCP